MPRFSGAGPIFRYLIRPHMFSKMIASNPDETRQAFPWCKAAWLVVYSPKVTGKQTFSQILPLSGQLPAGPPWGAHTSDKNTAELFLKVRGKNKYIL